MNSRVGKYCVCEAREELEKEIYFSTRFSYSLICLTNVPTPRHCYIDDFTIKVLAPKTAHFQDLVIIFKF